MIRRGAQQDCKLHKIGQNIRWNNKLSMQVIHSKTVPANFHIWNLSSSLPINFDTRVSHHFCYAGLNEEFHDMVIKSVT
jgi:hypothetical protein